jgi:hypothetical protein
MKAAISVYSTTPPLKSQTMDDYRSDPDHGIRTQKPIERRFLEEKT